MPEFIVVSEDEPATEDGSEAIDKFLRQIYSKDDVFREGVLDRCVNISFAERFFLVTDKENKDFEDGCLKPDLTVVGERIRAYFSAEPEVGEKYFAYLQSGDENILTDEVFEGIAASDPTGIAALEMAALSRI
jgi:hypothetical protein